SICFTEKSIGRKVKTVRIITLNLLNKIMARVFPPSKDEVEAIESWKNDYLSQLKALEEAKLNVTQLDKLRQYKDFDQNTAWNEIQHKIQLEEKVIPLRRNANRIYRWAAIFIFLITAVYVVTISFFDKVEPVEIVAQTSIIEWIADDNSKVTLDTMSVLVQRDYRQVELKGRAFFDVAKDPNHVFKIVTSNAEITVLGTAFFVHSTEVFSEIKVVEGKVAVTSKNEKVILEAGQSAIVTENNITLKQLDDNIFTDWTKNVLVFDNIELIEVLKSVANHFNFSLSLPNNLPESTCKIKTKFKNTQLNNVLQELSLIARFKYSIYQNNIIIEKIEC
ncbi:MAG: FecR domain-containing protein, partial [Saprospiraceae bacterium]